MRGLFLKIFAIFWLAQSLIFVITTSLILRQRFPPFNDALDTHLRHDAALALRDFENGGCAGFRSDSRDSLSADKLRIEPAGAALLSSGGQLLCSTADATSLAQIPSPLPNHIDGRAAGNLYLWLVPITSPSGERYTYIWFQPPSSHPPRQRRWAYLHFAFPELPVAIAVGGLTTFVLVLLFTRPVVRLRRAARSLANGNLSARVEQSPSAILRSSSDQFQGLIRDFNHMADRLESLVDAQKLLLRDVSHELRSPLARLSVALELAREDPSLGSDAAGRRTDGSRLGEHLDRIERETAKLNQLIGQLLLLSSIEARENTSTFHTLSLNQLCEELLSDAEYEAQQRSASVTLLQACLCTIRGDHELLYRAIENVVRNAIRYTEPGTQVTIRIDAITTEDTGEAGMKAAGNISKVRVAGAGEATGRWACVEVNDQGPGIPETELTRIFRPFYRVDYARSSATGGFGVGLAITERAVRLHGGRIRASNRPSGGASIVLLFPLETSAPMEP
jgi:two-component system sensor histidine kinase CpxA